MSIKIIIGQLIGFIGLVFSLISFNQNNKKSYAKKACTAALINSIHYLFLDAYSGLFTKIIAAIRELVIYKKSKNKEKISNFFFVGIIFIYVVALFVLYNNNFLNIFPICAAIIYFIVEWFFSIHTIKIFALICMILWLIYNIFVFSVSGIIYNIISIVSISLVLIKDKLSKNQEKNNIS